MNGRLLLVLVLAACHHGGKGSTKTATCADVATHVQQLLDPKKDTKADAAAKVHDIFAARCGQDKWPTAALACMAGTVSLHDGHHCKDQLNVDQRRSLDADLDAADREARAGRLPPACALYKQRMEKISKCDKLPQAARDALKQGYDAMISSIGDTDEARARAEQGCRMGADALNEVGKGSCGWT